MNKPNILAVGASLLLATGLVLLSPAHAEPIRIGGKPVEISVRGASENAVRVTVRPVGHPQDFPDNPALTGRDYPAPAIRLTEIEKPVAAAIGKLRVEILPHPLAVRVSGADGVLIQNLNLRDDGGVAFRTDDQPILGLGEGGPMPEKGEDWRKSTVEFDRSGRLHPMEPRWQPGAYGSRNPVALLVGTSGWGLHFATPWGRIDLRQPQEGIFFPIERKDPASMRQTFGNQQLQLGKGIPPMEAVVPGLLDLFVFDTRDPAVFMKDVTAISGAAVLPPKWALGYMQSHRTLETDAQMLGIADTFRAKRIPLDAVIYLGTGFTPQGWNTKQPSFEFNPKVFKRGLAPFVDDLHQRNVKLVLHMVPWDRDKLPRLDDAHLAGYWNEHVSLTKLGVDGWWPDEGDWFDLHERLDRHKLYYEGPISTQPDRRPWSLHRNGHLGIARWGGWIWSGDTDSTWKSLEAQIAVGINSSLSLSPYWGSDIGGFFSTKELSGELYARWFQFGAFCPSFRSHGRTWWTRLPWGWGLDNIGPVEDKNPPDLSSLNNPAIEPIARRYAELRYQLLSYNYTLAWEARETGMPFMRALWLHYPNDAKARGIGNEYFWGRDLLVAPVFEKGATARELYLPPGEWYDWWTGERQSGGRTISRKIDLATMPIYARAGAILPLDPIRQYTGEKVSESLTIRIYRGADGSSVLYDDDGASLGYLAGKSALTQFSWDDKAAKLTIKPQKTDSSTQVKPQTLRIQLVPDGDEKTVNYGGEPIGISF
ncbi:MAG: TIM-barrel domain-containing protein [Verrucomicrobiota bacterium]